MKSLCYVLIYPVPFTSYHVYLALSICFSATDVSKFICLAPHHNHFIVFYIFHSFMQSFWSPLCPGAVEGDCIVFSRDSDIITRYSTPTVSMSVVIVTHTAYV